MHGTMMKFRQNLGTSTGEIMTHLTGGIKANHENSHLLLAKHAFEDT